MPGRCLGQSLVSLLSLTPEDWGGNLEQGALGSPVWALSAVPASWNETASKSQ